MKRAFTFRLARVARVREVFEEEARGALAAALLDLREAEARYDALREELDAGVRAQAHAQTAKDLDVPGLLAHERALETLQRRLAEARLAAAEARAVAEEQRSIWQARKRDRQALDELADRDKQRHLGELARAENAEADEVATQRFSQSRS